MRLNSVITALVTENMPAAESNFTLVGKIDVYHYSKLDLGDKVTLNPEETVKHQSSYSRNDYKLSKFPRMFFYTDLNKTEHLVKSSSKALYKAEVDGSSILLLQSALSAYRENKEELSRKNKKAASVIHALLGEGYTDWDAMFKEAAKNFSGVFYETGGVPMVVLFTPVDAKKIQLP